LSNDFYEIKSLAEKIGTNRRLLSRKAEFEFVRPYDLIPKYRAFCEARPAAGGASEPTNCPQNSQCLDWSSYMKKLEPLCHELAPLRGARCVSAAPPPAALPLYFLRARSRGDASKDQLIITQKQVFFIPYQPTHPKHLLMAATPPLCERAP
jgi:hypothetical protein